MRMRTALIYLQIHFLSDLFSLISRFILLLQRNHVILPQVRETERKGGQEVTSIFCIFPLIFFLYG